MPCSSCCLDMASWGIPTRQMPHLPKCVKEQAGRKQEVVLGCWMSCIETYVMLYICFQSKSLSASSSKLPSLCGFWCRDTSTARRLGHLGKVFYLPKKNCVRVRVRACGGPDTGPFLNLLDLHTSRNCQEKRTPLPTPAPPGAWTNIHASTLQRSVWRGSMWSSQ